ncbi:hypothetical protein KKH23_08110 [Patescibacteria group bacterium]|nr:hypothetical protein [Patescibacteria group bacterium]
MATKEVYVGNVLMAEHDESDVYADDGTTLRGIRVAGQIRVDTAPTEDTDVVRKMDALSTSLLKRVSVADIHDPSTELASETGTNGALLIAYQVEAAENAYIIYIADTAVVGGSYGVPYAVPGDGCTWLAIGGLANTGGYLLALVVSLGLTVNDTNNSSSLVAKSANDDSCLVVAASSDAVGIGTSSPGAKLHVHGSALEGAVHKISTNEGSLTYPTEVVYQAIGTTVTNTGETLLTLPLATNKSALLVVNFIGRRVDVEGTSGSVGDTYGAVLTATIKNVSDTLTVVDQGGAGEVVTRAPTTNPCTPAVAVSGTDVLVQMAGRATTIITWFVTARVYLS